MSNKPAPAPPLHQPPSKQLQPTQILARIPSISPLPEEDEPETERQEPTTDQHELEQEHQEPEPEQQSELLPNRVPYDHYHADGTPDYEKASAYMGDVIARFKKNNKVILQ